MCSLVDDQGLAGPQIEYPWDRIPAITRITYRRNDFTIEVVHVVGFMGEDYVQTRCRRNDEADGDWIELGSNTTRTGYQLRRALDIQADAIRSYLAQT